MRLSEANKKEVNNPAYELVEVSAIDSLYGSICTSVSISARFPIWHSVLESVWALVCNSVSGPSRVSVTDSIKDNHETK